MFLSRDDWELGVAFQTHQGVRRRLEGKQRPSLSSRVATGISWSPLSGLKGVKPPLEFGERTRDCIVYTFVLYVYFSVSALQIRSSAFLFLTSLCTIVPKSTLYVIYS